MFSTISFFFQSLALKIFEIKFYQSDCSNQKIYAKLIDYHLCFLKNKKFFDDVLIAHVFLTKTKIMIDLKN